MSEAARIHGGRTRGHFRGCLLGGAVGDALGAAVEFKTLEEIRTEFGPAGIRDYGVAYGRTGAITDDTQMTLFTGEALLRAEHCRVRDPACRTADVAWHAYLRWLRTQGEVVQPRGLPDEDGWLVGVKGLHSRRAPGVTCLAALRKGRMGTIRDPLNDSKGCGGVMRVAPAGFVPGQPFRLGCELAALTHGHPTGWLAAGYLAQLVHEVAVGASLAEGAARALEVLERQPGHEETSGAIRRALALAHSEREAPEDLETLGPGFVAEEALAIALLAALRATGFEQGVLLAVNHSGDSDSTGSIAGNLLGLLHGEQGIPATWLERLELRDLIAGVATDLWLHFGEGEKPAGAVFESNQRSPDWDQYPGN